MQESFEVVARVTSRRAFVLCAPLVAPAGTVGVVFAARATPFDSKELALATAVAPRRASTGEIGAVASGSLKMRRSRSKGGGWSGSALCSPHTGLSARRRDQVSLAS